MKPVDWTKAIWAGFLATLVMTLVMYSLPLIGIPRMDIMLALGSIFPWKISPYIIGALLHFVNGIILALIYAALFYSWLPGPGWLKGALFSLLPWLFAITLLGSSLQLAARILGAAPSPFAANPCAAKAVNPCAPKAVNPCAPGAASQGGIPPQVLSLIVHLIYGAVLGARYRPRR